jgi:hypothetical protein
MRSAGIILARIAGGILIAAALLQWALFDYDRPDTLPAGQVLNWVLVVVLAAPGWFLLTLGRKPQSKEPPPAIGSETTRYIPPS